MDAVSHLRAPKLRALSRDIADRCRGRNVKVFYKPDAPLHLAVPDNPHADAALVLPTSRIPMHSFRLTGTPTADGIFLFLTGMARNHYEVIRAGCKTGLIPRSVNDVEVSGERTVYFPVLGYLRLNFIPVNPSPVDFFANEIFRSWVERERTTTGSRITDSYLNAWQALVATAFAFRNQVPPVSDSFFAERTYSRQGEKLLAEIAADPASRDRFRTFATRSLDITRPTRYIQFLNYLVNSDIGQRVLRKQKIRILDVGGCPYSKTHGAPAARYLLETLEGLYPDKEFEIVVADKFYPHSFPIQGVEKDVEHQNITYMQGDIAAGSPEEAGFDVVICNRVLTEPHFQKNPDQYEAARRNLYASLRDGDSVLFLDQGYSHWIEIWRRNESDISHDRYYALMSRIDLWFLVSTLKLFSDPRLKLQDAKAQLSQIYGEDGVPPHLWATAAKYFKSLMDADDRQAVILWRICLKTDGSPITPALKDEAIPQFLRRLGRSVREEAKMLIDRVSNPETVDLRGLNRLDAILAQIGLKVNRELLFTSKLQTTSLDREITAALGIEESFLRMDGVINKVTVISSTSSSRKYLVEFHLYNDIEPLKPRKVAVTVVPSAVGESIIVKDLTS